ncbi:uncharacterized protein LY89DRAFT_688620 [Mollisia scopiformis]|uniref:Uncharacterized protein n=1 Tax=Mollisia scopiformis TaxID=149040 RepID=A0A194WWU8_MOLSC|nr:uncharacterized protein LY89DRAFT_688620 [Mollisia scopiformis]KUJ12159.1 hypothetical protein LY89DRAFT_688620 [Mollisia scopiformis]
MSLNIFGGKKSDKSEGSGEGGGKRGGGSPSVGEYISKIDEFLNEVEGRSFSMFKRRDDSLGDMLAWARYAYRERSKMENHINMQAKSLHRASGKIEDQYQRMENMQAEINDLEFKRGRLVRERDELVNEHNRELTHIAELRSMEVDKEGEKHREQVTNIRKDHQKEKDKLVAQLLVSQRDDQGWPDDKMGIKFRELQRLMESVTAPRNREFLIPAGQKLPSHLDKTGFLTRAGNAKSHFWLKSTLWSIIAEQFFSAPFGFGVLGPGKSQKHLFEMYAAWRKLFDANAVAASPDREDYAVFRQDVLANNWRSTTFQYINVALTTPEQSHSPIAQLNTENFNDTVSRITRVLSEVANLSHAEIRPEIQDQIRQMVALGRDIALQFGIQPAQMQLVVPKYGEKIKIGEKFHDCEDGDSFKGKTQSVDIVTAPGLEKLGDGRSDLSAQRAMVPCEIYPIEED